MSSAKILGRRGNWTVIHLPGRQFPALAMQGDNFHDLVARLRLCMAAIPNGAGDEAREELQYVLDEIEQELAWYVEVLKEKGMRKPWHDGA